MPKIGSRGYLSRFPFQCECGRIFAYTLNALNRAREAGKCHLCQEGL